MGILWTFGDSFTFGQGCRPDGYYPEYFYKYRKEGDNIWPVLLSNRLNIDLINHGKCGASNDYILDSIIKNFNNIKEGDYVIVGKTLYQRFDVKNNLTGDFFHVSGYGEKNLIDKYRYFLRNDEEVEILLNYAYYFASDPIFKERQDLRFNFIKDRLVEKNIFYYEWMFLDNIIKDFELIKTQSKNEFDDGHFSFKGHQQMCDYIYEIIQNPKKLI